MTALLDRLESSGDRVRRISAGAALGVVVALSVSVVVGARQDVHNQGALRAFLSGHGPQMVVAWVFSVLAFFAWLMLTVGLRRMLPRGFGRDLFVAAVVAGQALTVTGASLAAAAAPPEAREVPLAVYNAFVESGHLAAAAGTAATGLGFVALAVAAVSGAGLGLPRWWVVATRVAGVVLIVTAVAGPVTLPVTAAWLMATAIMLARPAKSVPLRDAERA